MTEDYKLCEWCRQEIEQGRSDKRFCNKLCYNHFKNHEYRNANETIKGPVESYKRYYRALAALINEFGSGANIRLVKAV